MVTSANPLPKAESEELFQRLKNQQRMLQEAAEAFRIPRARDVYGIAEVAHSEGGVGLQTVLNERIVSHRVHNILLWEVNVDQCCVAKTDFGLIHFSRERDLYYAGLYLVPKNVNTFGNSPDRIIMHEMEGCLRPSVGYDHFVKNEEEWDNDVEELRTYPKIFLESYYKHLRPYVIASESGSWTVVPCERPQIQHQFVAINEECLRNDTCLLDWFDILLSDPHNDNLFVGQGSLTKGCSTEDIQHVHLAPLNPIGSSVMENFPIEEAEGLILINNVKVTISKPAWPGTMIKLESKENPMDMKPYLTQICEFVNRSPTEREMDWMILVREGAFQVYIYLRKGRSLASKPFDNFGLKKTMGRFAPRLNSYFEHVAGLLRHIPTHELDLLTPVPEFNMNTGEKNMCVSNGTEKLLKLVACHFFTLETIKTIAADICFTDDTLSQLLKELHSL